MKAGLWFAIGLTLAGGSTLALAEATGSIEGIVTDSATQSPVRKAQVMLIPRAPLMAPPSIGASGPMPIAASRRFSGSRVGQAGGGQAVPAMPQPAPVVTDSAGSFAFRDLAPGRYGVQVQHPQYPVRPDGPAPTEVEVKANEVSHPAVTLIPGASISGRIVDEDDDPIAGCIVQLRAPGVVSAGFGNVSLQTQPSNERGEYRVHRLLAGKYVAVAHCMHAVFQPRPFSSGPPPPPMFGYPLQFYPQAADSQSASTIEVAAGAERTGIDFRMKPVRVYTVSGTVSGIDAGSNLNVSVMAAPTQQTGFGMRSSRIDPVTGGFMLQSVLPGSYAVIANQHASDPRTPPMTALQAIEVTDRSLQVNLRMQKAVDIPGTVVVEGERSVPPQQVSIQITPEGQSFVMAPRAEMQQDGTLIVKGVLPGVWRVMAYGPNCFLRAIEAGGQPLTGLTLDTSKGMPGALRFLVSTRTATVQGNGNPGLTYTFVQDGEPMFGRRHVAQADAKGTVKMEGLAPGKYKVYEGTMPDDAMLLQSVTVTEAATVELDLSKRPANAR